MGSINGCVAAAAFISGKQQAQIIRTLPLSCRRVDGMKTDSGQRANTIDYKEVAERYDAIRKGIPQLMKAVVGNLSPSMGDLVLDLCCGTGINTRLFAELTAAQIIGLDLSREMLCKARSKLPSSSLVRGEASALPFRTGCFDHVIMTEAIHHLSNKNAALQAILDILKENGQLCIATQSHNQIEKRMTSRFFPSTLEVDQRRYPKIFELEASLSKVGFVEIGTAELTLPSRGLNKDFLECVRNKGFSMLHKISPQEYETGLRKLKAAMDDENTHSHALGYTLVYAEKP